MLTKRKRFYSRDIEYVAQMYFYHFLLAAHQVVQSSVLPCWQQFKDLWWFRTMLHIIWVHGPKPRCTLEQGDNEVRLAAPHGPARRPMLRARPPPLNVN